MEQSYACAVQLGPDAANVPGIQSIDFTAMPEDNPSLNRLFGCLWEKKGFIDKQGVIYPEKVKAYLLDLMSLANLDIDADGVISEVLKSCEGVKGSDYKIKSIRMQNCINSNLSAYGRN